jgi:hypothetical protein
MTKQALFCWVCLALLCLCLLLADAIEQNYLLALLPGHMPNPHVGAMKLFPRIQRQRFGNFVWQFHAFSVGLSWRMIDKNSSFKPA